MTTTRVLIAALLPIGIAGCASRAPIRGYSPNPEPSAAAAAIGRRYVDFKFIDSKGVERPIRRELGDFTVLALTRCDRSTHGPAVDLLRAVVDANHNLDNVKVVGVDIHWSPGGCKEHDRCHLVGAEPNLGTICDATGAIHRAYGDHPESWFYVIGPDKTIILAAPATRGAELSRELEAEARQLSHEREEASFEEHG